jgi:hypothetical protein
MTNGSLTSRNTKSKLHKQSLLDLSTYNISCYRSYRNVYNTLLILSKKFYFENNLKGNVKNPWKSWELLKKALQSKKKKIETEQKLTACLQITHWILFQQIMSPTPNPPELLLGLNSLATVYTTIHNFKQKKV